MFRDNILRPLLNVVKMSPAITTQQKLYSFLGANDIYLCSFMENQKSSLFEQDYWITFFLLFLTYVSMCFLFMFEDAVVACVLRLRF